MNGSVFAAPLKGSTNWHDAFVSLDDTLGIATRSRKPKAVDLIKWLAKKGVEKIQEEHQQVITGIQREHQLAITDPDNRIQAIQCENITLQAQRDVYQTQLQRSEDTITHLRAHYVDHSRDPGKANIIVIVRKHTTSANNKYHDLPYYVCRIQRRKRYVKLRSIN